VTGRRRKAIIATLLALAPAAPTAARPAGGSLPPQGIGECAWIYGRLNAWNGNPTFRIWIVGTSRMLGVPGEDWPMPIGTVLAGKTAGQAWNTDISAIFESAP
jgi:hypothetical protein